MLEVRHLFLRYTLVANSHTLSRDSSYNAPVVAIMHLHP